MILAAIVLCNSHLAVLAVAVQSAEKLADERRRELLPPGASIRGLAGRCVLRLHDRRINLAKLAHQPLNQATG